MPAPERRSVGPLAGPRGQGVPRHRLLPPLPGRQRPPGTAGPRPRPGEGGSAPGRSGAAADHPLRGRPRRRPGLGGSGHRTDPRHSPSCLFVLHAGIAWEHQPQELGCGSGTNCWRCLAEWTRAGVWPRLHEVVLAKLRGANALDFSRAAVDGSPIRALNGGSKTGRSHVDQGAGRAANTTIPLFRRCRRCMASAAGPGTLRTWCWATAATTTTSTAASSAVSA
ncbi:transposase [Streptomyces sp. NPDC046161]|uniref:transposase n=1 Tax=Streptomyces sp. NPDC046161 TaxID=3155132 RepID=UPI0033E26775